MQHVSWHHINKMSKAGGEQAVNDPGWWSSPKGMECETHHNRFTREKIHVRVAESLAFGLIISCIKQHGGGNGKLAGSSKVGEFARDTLRYLARQKKETFNWEKVKNDIIEKGGYIHYITSDVGRPTE